MNNNDQTNTLLSENNGNSPTVEQIVDRAVKTKNLSVIKIAARSKNPDTRMLTLKKLSNSDRDLRIGFLIELLREDGNWKEIRFSKGEDIAVQQRELSLVASELGRIGITVDKELLFQNEYRRGLISSLQKIEGAAK